MDDDKLAVVNYHPACLELSWLSYYMNTDLVGYLRHWKICLFIFSKKNYDRVWKNASK